MDALLKAYKNVVAVPRYRQHTVYHVMDFKNRKVGLSGGGEGEVKTLGLTLGISLTLPCGLCPHWCLVVRPCLCTQGRLPQ
jgi:hypothetical protein